MFETTDTFFRLAINLNRSIANALPDISLAV